MHFVEAEDTLQYSQELIICPYPESDQSNRQIKINNNKIVQEKSGWKEYKQP
jgi:hypothetical protein